jgi:hypothetical protein
MPAMSDVASENHWLGKNAKMIRKGENAKRTINQAIPTAELTKWAPHDMTRSKPYKARGDMWLS